MVRPIRTLDEGAQRIGAGDLDQQDRCAHGRRAGGPRRPVQPDDGSAARVVRRASSTRSRSARRSSRTRSSSRRRSARSCASSRARRPTCSRCSTPSPSGPRTCATRRTRACCWSTATCSARAADLFEQEDEPDRASVLPDAAAGGRRSTAAPCSTAGRSIIADVVPAPRQRVPGRAPERRAGTESRAVLAVPLMREGGAYGSIFVFRREPGLFSPRPGRAGGDLRAAGGDRHRQRAPVQRDEEGARAADRDRRNPARDLELADRRAAGARCDRRARRAPLRCLVGVDVSDRGKRASAPRIERALAGSGHSRRCAADQPRFAGRARAARAQDDPAARPARGGGRVSAQLTRSRNGTAIARSS